MNLQEMVKYRNKLKVVDAKDSTDFYMLFSEGMTLLSLLDEDVSREFGVSRPTINRWRNGRNAPHPMMRTPVYDWLIDRTSRLIEREGLKKKARSGGGHGMSSYGLPMAAKGK